MLSKQAQEKLLKALKFPAEKIAELLGESEVDVDVPALTILDENGLKELKSNIKKGHDEAFPEIKGKELNEKYKLGLSTTDAKDLDKVMEAMKAVGIKEAGIAPNDRIKELETSLQKLQNEVVPNYEKQVSEWKGKYAERETFDKYVSVIPPTANKFLTPDEHVARVKKVVAIGDNGVAINPATGEAYKDNLEKPIPFNEYVGNLYKTNEGWLQPENTGNNNGKPNFHHSTQGGGGGKVKVDIEAIRAKYDVTDPQQRIAMQQEVTAATLNAAKVGI